MLFLWVSIASSVNPAVSWDFFVKTESANACESHKLGRCLEDCGCSVRVSYCFSSSVMFWMETKMTFIFLRKETESKFSKIASLCVMISNYALVDRIQVLTIFLSKSILKYHHDMIQWRNTLFSFFAWSLVYEETETESVYISNRVSGKAQRGAM